MRFLFAALLALAAGVGLTLLAQHDPGYVLLRYRGWSVESSLTVLLGGLLLAFVVFYLLLRLLWTLWHLPVSLLAWWRYYQQRRAQRRTNSGLIALAEGHWTRAEKRLAKGAAYSDTPLINYLGAARAAQKLGSKERRDAYLAQAYRSMPEAKLAVGLTQADLQLSQGQLEQALASLRELQRFAPRHVYVLYLLKKLYERLQSWEDLRLLLPELRRHHVLRGEALERFELNLYQHWLADSKDLAELRVRWQEIAKGLRQQPTLLASYAELLLAQKAWQDAEQVLQPYLKKHYHAGLARLYGQLSQGEPNQHLVFLERWLEAHGEDPELLLACGRLSRQEQLWGKARSYLEASLAREERQETRRELAELLIQLGEKDQALTLYRQQPVAVGG